MGKTTRKLARELRKQVRSPRTKYLLLTSGAAYLTEGLVRNALRKGWRWVYDEDPPRNPERLDVTWSDALAWTIVTSLAFSTAGLFARRGAAVGWKRYTGRRIPR